MDTKPPIETVFIGLAGVLCDFVKGACLVHNKHPDHLPKGVRRWPVAFGMEEKEFWSPLAGRYFWEVLEEMPDMWDMIHAATRYGFCPLILAEATNVGRSCGSWAGQVAWVRSHLNNYNNRLIITHRPCFVAGPGKLLVSDDPEQCNAWIAHKGDAILVPRPWNTDSGLAGAAADSVRTDFHLLSQEGRFQTCNIRKNKS